MAQSVAGRFVIPVLGIAFTLAALNNVYGDATEVKAMAEQIACGKVGCAVTLVGESRSPFAHTYIFQTSLEHQTTAQVECTRAFVLAGEYACQRK